MEATLYNKYGKPVAYLADDNATIYLWDGRAAAYVRQDHVYGFNGKQLGWFANGTIFDIYGFRSGFVKSKSPIATDKEPIKPIKQIKARKAERTPPVVKPAMCYGFSEKNLEVLIEEGISP